MKKTLLVYTISICTVLLLVIGWKLPYYLRFESIKLPDDCEIIYNTKVTYTDIYNGYILCEKVIKCDKGAKYVEQYIRENNSGIFADRVHAHNYFGAISDIDVYYWEFDKNFDINNMSNEEQDKYVHIGYVK